MRDSIHKSLRATFAVLVCLSGWALVPFTSLPLQAFGWEQFAEAYGEIFRDAFETGDTSAWSRVVGEVDSFEVDDPDDFTLSFRVDEASWNRREDQIVVLASGLSKRRLPTFVLEARRHDAQLELRARAMSETNVWVESPWRSVHDDYTSIAIEWRRSMRDTDDGLLYISVDDDLLIWLVDLDNWLLPLRTLEVTRLNRTPAIHSLDGTLELGTLESEDSTKRSPRGSESPTRAVESTEDPTAGGQASAGGRTKGRHD